MIKITKTTWLDIIASPFFMALPIAIGVILLLPDVFQKYIVTETWSGKGNKKNSIEEYHDLDNDGQSEWVIAFHNEFGLPAIKVMHNDGTLIDQWNLTGKLIGHNKWFYCADLDNDSLKEIYLLTKNRDSIYLNAINPVKDGRLLFKNKFIAEAGVHEGKSDVSSHWGKTADLDGDGYKELIFNLHAGYAKQPRGLFAYNDRLDTIIQTPVFGANINRYMITDLNGDNKPEIFCSGSTVGNIPDSLGIPYSDYSSWLMGFNEKLEFLFDPVDYNAYPSSIIISKIKSGGKERIVGLFLNRSKSELPSFLAMIDEKGESIRKKLVTEIGIPAKIQSILSVIDYKDYPAIMTKWDDHSIVFLDTLFQAVGAVSNIESGNLLFKTDLDQNGRDELIFSLNKNQYIITQAGCKDPVYVKVDRNDYYSVIPNYVSVKKNGTGLPELFIKYGNKVSYFTYRFNLLYYLKYPVWLGIYFVVLTLIMLIRYIQKKQLQRKMEIENRLNVLQLKTIKSQMNPHFMFNVLNSISTSILSEKKENAYRYMIKFSSLLRLLFTKTEELVIPLQEELKFVENYLELEKYRFKDKLDYDITVNPDVSLNTAVPRMLLQLFVENALKHGLGHKEGGGIVSIRVEQAKKQIQIIIEDNGIGRHAAGQYEEGHGTGTHIIDEMLVLYQKTKSIQITYRYEDLYDDSGKAIGTRVVVRVPVMPPDLSGGAETRSIAKG